MSFASEFDAALGSAGGLGSVFGEKWSLDGTEYDAISIDPLDASARAALGGLYKDVSTAIYVELSVFTASGVKQGSMLTVRGERLRVGGIGNDGDASRTLYCGPATVNLRG